MLPVTRTIQGLARIIRRDEGGNIAIMSAFITFVVVLLVGMAVDYTLAQRRQDQINAIADAAALGAVTPAMISQSASASQAAAQTMFMGQVGSMYGVSLTPSNVSVVANDTVSGSNLKRTVTISYTGSSQNAFAALLGMQSLPLSGTSTATAGLAPNIDFYLLLDTSPSMEIAATTSGITTMVANTSAQGGCAFGCHETNPKADNLGNPNGEDNYALARNLGVTLRIDLVNQATQNLMSYAQNTEPQTGAAYRAAIYTMDYSVNTIQTLTANLSQAAQSAAAIAAVTVYDNNCLTPSNCNSDEDSYLDNGLGALNGYMPNPGSGTKSSTPQEVLFIVSDGVNDEILNGSRAYPPIGTTNAPHVNTDWCTLIKQRGIRIAFLYTTYNPLPTNSWYNTYIAPEQSQIAPAAQACASPGLYFQVSTDGNISAAMTTLFQKAIATARLTQ